MDSILYLFYRVTSVIAILTMLLPIFAAYKVRRNGIVFSADIKLFEFYVYFLFIFQITALTLSRGFGLHNVILFRIFLLIHMSLFAHFLIKWSGISVNTIFFILPLLVFSILGDFFFGDPNFAPDFIIWSDAIILLLLSFFLSYRIDKIRFNLPRELNSIHIGIYIYSLITVIGISPSHNDLRLFGFFVQTIAVVISNFYFARSFRCLYH